MQSFDVDTSHGQLAVMLDTGDNSAAQYAPCVGYGLFPVSALAGCHEAAINATITSGLVHFTWSSPFSCLKTVQMPDRFEIVIDGWLLRWVSPGTWYVRTPSGAAHSLDETELLDAIKQLVKPADVIG